MTAALRSSVLMLLAFFPDVVRTNRVDSLAEDPLPIPHLRHLAAHGIDEEAFRAAVEANAGNAGALLDVSSDLGIPQSWPAHWKGKLGRPKAVGKGAYGTVYVVPLMCNPSMKVAVKELKGRNPEVLLDAVVEEVDALLLFSYHPNFVAYFDYGKAREPKQAHYIMMEAATGGDLREHLGTRHAGALFLGLLKGVMAMHQKNIVHRDLKPANVLVSSKCGEDPPCTAKVADLGLACSTKGSQKIPPCIGMAGTPLYLAPEYLDSEASDPANDVWALGLILYELTFKSLPPPFERAPTLEKLYTEIKKFDISKDANYKAMTDRRDQKRKELIGGMLKLQHKQRLTAAEAVVLAKQWGEDEGWEEKASGMTATLPECFDQEDPKPEADEESADLATGEFGFFTIGNPKTNMAATMVFKVIDPNGVVQEAIRTQKREYLGNAVCLKPKDQIIEVNGMSWKDGLAKHPDTVQRLQEGVYGALVFKYQKA